MRLVLLVTVLAASPDLSAREGVLVLPLKSSVLPSPTLNAVNDLLVLYLSQAEVLDITTPADTHAFPREVGAKPATPSGPSKAAKKRSKIGILPIRYVGAPESEYAAVVRVAVAAAARGLGDFQVLTEAELERQMGFRAHDRLSTCRRLECIADSLVPHVDYGLLVVVSLKDSARWRITAALLNAETGQLDRTVALSVSGTAKEAARAAPEAVHRLAVKQKRPGASERKRLEIDAHKQARVVFRPITGQSDTKIAVLRAQFDDSAAGQVPEKIFDEALLTALQRAGDFQVIGQGDLEAVLGFEREKELLGCDAVQCMAEIAGALNVHKLIVVRVAFVGSEWAVTAKLIRIQGEPTVEARTTQFVPGGAAEILKAPPQVIHGLLAVTQ